MLCISFNRRRCLANEGLVNVTGGNVDDDDDDVWLYSVAVLKSKSGSKISKTSVALVTETTDKPASSLFEDLDNSSRMLESLKSDPWPDRTDEYGIPIYQSSEEEELAKEVIIDTL